MKHLEEDALTLLKEAVGESGTVSIQAGSIVEIIFDSGPTVTFRMNVRTRDSGPEPDAAGRVLRVVRRANKAELADLRARGESFVALTGSVRIQVPGVLIDRTDLKLRKKQGGRPSRRSAFSDRASLIPRWLFSQPPGRPFTLTELARAADVSPSVASYAVRDLAQRGLVASEENGRERRIRLIDHTALIEAWTREYAWKDNVRLSVHAPIGSLQRFLTRLARLPLPRHALTLHAGASLSLPHAPVEQVHVYVDLNTLAQVSDLAGELDWPIDPDGRLQFLIPAYRTSVWTGVRCDRDIPRVSDLQLTLDLWNHPIRGREQAEVLLEKLLRDLESS